MATPEQSSSNSGLRSALRQGHVFSPEESTKLDAEGAEGDLLIVASHDCDCVQPPNQEPYIELMRCRMIEAADGNYTNAKNPRLLHLAAKKSGSDVTLELKAGPKLAVLKSAVNTMSADNSLEIGESGKRTLSIWLRSRYSRAALPDALNNRLTEVKSTIQDALRPNPEALHGIYIAFDPPDEIADGDIYEIDLLVVYDSEKVGAEKAAEHAATKIKRRFEKKFMQPGPPNAVITWKKVFLSLCEAISDINFTFADTLSFQRLNFDHLSLREDPQIDVPE